MYLSIYLSIYLSLSISIYLPLSLSLSISIRVLYIAANLAGTEPRLSAKSSPPSASISRNPPLYTHKYISINTRLICVHTHIHISIYIYIYLSFSLSLSPSLSIYISIRVSHIVTNLAGTETRFSV